MILLYHPTDQTPLSVLALAAVLEDREDYKIIDGNVDANASRALVCPAARVSLAKRSPYD